MSRAIARVLYRWRLFLSAAIVLGALLLAPRANLTRIDNDLTAWFSREVMIGHHLKLVAETYPDLRSAILERWPQLSTTDWR